MKYIPLIVTLTGTAATALLFPAYVSSHVTLFAVLTAASQLLHAALPSIFGGPTN